MKKFEKCSECNGSGIVAFSEYEVYKCNTCAGQGTFCEHQMIQPCVPCVDELELEWYHHEQHGKWGNDYMANAHETSVSP